MISVLRDVISGEADFIYLVIYLCSMAFVVFCTLPLHEFAHAFMAVKLGDDTPKIQGRLTISPMAHISPFGVLMIVLFGFGYAKPVPVRMRNFKNPKRDMAIVALAGPICNLLQATVFMLLYNAVFAFQPSNLGFLYIGMFFFYAASVNVSLAVFNLIPIPPLDGSRLLTALLPSKYYFKIMQYERQIMLVLFILLLTGVLSTPLSYLSSFVLTGITFITRLPFTIF